MASNFKSDDSFLRKLIIGAAGTNSTINRLLELGFDPIELERGSTGYKIWKKIKIKRIRVPDILCLKTGIRFESRGKTKAEISMSHSTSDPNRSWDAGLRDEDYVSVVVFSQDAENAIDVQQISPVHFISVKDMRYAYVNDMITISKPKGFEEGSEIRVVWPTASANNDSKVSSITDNKITLDPLTGGRKQTVFLPRKNGDIMLIPQVIENQNISSNQIIASVMPVVTSIPCGSPVNEAFFTSKLISINLSDRYAAAKALRYIGFKASRDQLIERMDDPNEDIYVQLEAAAALAAYDYDMGWQFMEGKINGSTMNVPLETQLETIIVLSEIPGTRSESLLISILQDHTRNDELRAGAAWALGQFQSNGSAEALVNTFNANPVEIKIEAARALLRIAEPQTSYLVGLLQKANPANRDGVSWVLSRVGNFDPSTIQFNNDDNLRRWLSYIIGYGRNNFSESDIEKLCNADPEIYFAASVLWQLFSSWIHDLKEF